MIITLKQLKALGACEEQRDLFESLFGESVEVTLELCLKHAQSFDWGWAAINLLHGKAGAAYSTASAGAGAIYDVARAEAWETYSTASAEAFFNAAQMEEAHYDP